jgi:hypothetical protein
VFLLGFLFRLCVCERFFFLLMSVTDKTLEMARLPPHPICQSFKLYGIPTDYHPHLYCIGIHGLWAAGASVIVSEPLSRFAEATKVNTNHIWK